MKFLRNPFSHIFLPVLVVVIALSFYRFMIAADYDVQYEGECDPITQNCFVGCEDDECTEEYYYSIIEKHAIDVRGQCGTDITDCALAQVCTPDEAGCSVTFCDADSVGEGEECEAVEEEEEIEASDVTETPVLEGEDKDMETTL